MSRPLSSLGCLILSVFCVAKSAHVLDFQPDPSNLQLGAQINHINTRMTSPCVSTPVLLTTDDYNALPYLKGDETYAYAEGGEQTGQYGELYLPKDMAEMGDGTLPVVLLIHGGCWLQTFDKHGVSSLAAAIASEVGYMVYAITYRRLPEIAAKPCCSGCASTGDCEGDASESHDSPKDAEDHTDTTSRDDWNSDTFADVASATAELQTIKAKHPQMNLDCVIGVGHSAGGHLALWAASRHAQRQTTPSSTDKQGEEKLEKGSAGDEIETRDSVFSAVDETLSVPFKAVVSLAGIADLRDGASKEVCGNSIVRLMGGASGTSDAVDERYNWASPIENLPAGVQQVLIHGAVDQFVPSTLNDEYFAKATQTVVTPPFTVASVQRRWLVSDGVPSAPHTTVTSDCLVLPCILLAFESVVCDDITQHFVHGAGHFEVILPEGESWALLKYVLKSLYSNYG
ncbi:hypothetical protein SARC_09324 [Sphaeroforma arctica JP610]|uniref:BD-FAE-like domain-containing protein n=1 Tax=Sphaeroforma arctica JP610 TaxID=667725 RepID=A0A0L0FND9_9EUKA|nr:hypothetical protein SARC_09324 [Sphaeroforma arctica JP610]KNC78239.1 hypothetical protein SARC_09324 [Sphaeroforma arctica JP610]|eukprot:XP_014152141.1 hypothetical protein SARC_09324 [Sphaeroforma arctica JP610]